MLETNVGVLVSMGIEQGWIKYGIISDQGDVKEIIGPFDSREEAKEWSEDHIDEDCTETHEIVHMVTPYPTKV